jgi:glycosyltransferase involved in cell wall biosynthesis
VSEASDQPAGRPPDLVVVVVARNEVQRIPVCLGSLSAQSGPARLRVLVSDNASTDGTASAAHGFDDRLDLTVRTTEPLGPSAHFVSAGRWALTMEPAAAHFAFLAGDDTWTAGFVSATLAALAKEPTAGMAFPAFEWEGDAGPSRLLSPLALGHRSSRRRQRRALMAPDAREMANLAYGVFRRDAFADLVDAWESGGDEFAADYAAVWNVLGSRRPVSCPEAVGRRHVRSGADLLERVGLRRDSATNPVSLVSLYIRLNLRINRQIGMALRRASPSAPPCWQTQLLRAPQWLWGAVGQLMTGLSRTKARA